jgi:bifunctional non-homologous end joining protein LigD
MPPDPFPPDVQPMLPTLSKTPFSNSDWIFEPKWDGYRAICFIREGLVRLVSRRRNDLTKKFPTLQSIASSIKAESAVLDGEIVALDQHGIPCFDALRSRRAGGDCVIVYYAFDLLYFDGRNLTQHPLVERKAALKNILPKGTKQRIRYTDHIIGKGKELLAELEKRELEGIVAKRADSFYVGGRIRAWLKIKTRAGREEMRKRSEAWQL